MVLPGWKRAALKRFTASGVGAYVAGYAPVPAANHTDPAIGRRVPRCFRA